MPAEIEELIEKSDTCICRDDEFRGLADILIEQEDWRERAGESGILARLRLTVDVSQR